MNFIKTIIQTYHESQYQRYLNEIAISTLMNHRKASQEELIKGVSLAVATNRNQQQFVQDYQNLVYGKDGHKLKIK